MMRSVGIACSVGLAVIVFIGGTARAEYVETFEFGLDAGYRLDDFDWDIAGTAAGTDPNVLSELTWDELEIYQVGASGKLAVGNEFVDFLTYIRGSVNYGWITGGSWQDSDFHGDNRTLEFSRSIGTTADDNVFDASGGLGFQWMFQQKRLAIAPLGGYSYHEQNLRNTSGVQTVSLPGFGVPAAGPVAGLNATYETEWQGPWAGIDLAWTPFSRFSLLGSFEYHWAEYEAKADWNLRSDFAHPVSFTHEADDASGIVVKVAGRYLLASRWALDLSYLYQDWQAEDGVDRTFFANGATTEQKLNEVSWKSSAVTVGLSCRFD